MLDVSIVIPSWNAKEHLRRCIESIFEETEEIRIEVIVVDNASDDGSPEMVEEAFPHVILIKNDSNLGFGKACNLGMETATGKYIALVNSDIILGNHCLEKMYRYMEQHIEIGILGPRIHNPDGTLQRTCRGFPTLWNSYCRALALDRIFPKSKLFAGQFMTYWTYDAIRSVDFLSGCLMMIRSFCLEKVGFFDERFFIFAEDKDLCKRFWKAEFRVVFYPDAEAMHFHAASSANDPTRFYMEEVKANFDYWRKHHSRFHQFWFRIAVLLHQVFRLLAGIFIYSIRPSARSEIAQKIKRSYACIRWMLGFSYSC